MSAIKTSAAQNQSAPVKSKKLAKLLASTTLAAASLMALGTTAHADNWTDHTILDGSTSVDLSIPNTTNITQNTSFVKAQGSGDINAGWTVNVAQPSNSAKYVLYDVTGDATQLMGALNANGEIYIFNQQGIIFGADSAVNVGAIITSTGNISDANIKAGNLVFENVDTGASIVLNGSVTVAEGGLAAFVAPQVINNGIITAKLGKVAMASGNKVTLDLYGDNLIEIAVDDKSTDGLIKNSGVINAEGGFVAMSVQTAKAAVDDVINMGGIVSASSATVQGGKIILSGGKQGKVTVSGKVAADGATGGGKVKITGEDIDVSQAAFLSADATTDGNGGDIYLYADRNTMFRGRASALGGLFGGNGGFVEISANNEVGYDGSVTTYAENGLSGHFLIDPLYAVIHSGSLNTNNATDRFISAAALANDLRNNASVTVQATNYIDVGTNTASAGIGTGVVDVSTALTIIDYLPTDSSGNILLPSSPGYAGRYTSCNNGSSSQCIPNYGPGAITTGSLTLQSDIVNVNKNLILGTGNLTVDANVLNLNGRISGRSTVGGATTLLTDPRLIGATRLDEINVLGNSARINQAIAFADSISNKALTVAAGTYNESVNVNKSNLNVKGANAGKAGTDVTRGAETIINPNSPGFYVTGNNVTVDGFSISGASGADGYGVWVDFASNAVVKNNVISGTSQAGVFGNGATTLTINNNLISGAGADGIKVNGDNSVTTISGNAVTNSVLSGINAYGLFNGSTINDNTINNAGNDGIYGGNTTKATIKNNVLDNVNTSLGGYGAISTDGGSDLEIIGNDIDGSVGHGIRVIGATGTNLIGGNFVDGVSQDGVRAESVSGLTVSGNKIGETGTIGGNGVFVQNSAGVQVLNNEIANTSLNGIFVDPSPFSHINGNTITGFGLNANGIFLDDGDDSEILGNTVTGSNGAGQTGIRVNISDRTRIGAAGAASRNTVSDVGTGIAVTGSEDILVRNNNITSTNTGITLDSVTGSKVLGNDISGSLANGIQVWNSSNVLVGNGADASSNLKNIITNSGWDGVNVQGGNNVTIKNNTIQTVTGASGVAVINSASAVVMGNRIHDTGRLGVYAGNADDIQITDNTITDAGLENAGNYLSGIHVEASDNVSVTDNRINRAKGDGINLGDGINWSDGANTGMLIVNSNTVRNVARDGIHGTANINQVNNNVAYKTGNDGIWLNNSTGAQVSGNIIGQTGPIGGNGITVNNSNSAVINDNYVRQASLNGIFVDPSDDVEISYNDVAFSGTNGIYLLDGNRGYIHNNIVGESGQDGIKVDNNDDVRVHNNYVDGSGDSGIEVRRSFSADIYSNHVSHSGGNGIKLGKSNRADIRNNEVTESNDNGIVVSNSNHVRIRRNDVSDAGNDGIVVKNGTGTTTVSGNTVYNVDKGIRATNTAGLTINGNTVYNTDENAVHVVDSASAQITNNLVGTLGFVNGTGIFVDPSPFTSITGNTVNGSQIGIHVLDSDNVTVGGFGEDEENTITESGTGILVDNSDNADILHNRIYGTGTGVHILNSAYADVLGNTVQGYGYGTGVLVENGDNARIGDGRSSEDGDHNTISDVDTGIAVRGVWDGDYIDGSDYVTIDNNEVYSVNNGIDATDTYSLNIEDNDLSGGHCGWGNGTGIYVGDSENVRIGGRHDGNEVDSFWNGIAVSNSEDVRIRRNDVWNISNDGIQVFGGNHVLIARNNVSDVGNDGIYVGDMSAWNYDGESEELTPNVIIRKNNIDWTDGDGIVVSNINFSLIEKNKVGLDGGDDEASIGGNGITVVGYSEIDPTIIRNNLVANVEYDGIFVGGVADVTIKDNTLWNIGNDGISVEDAWDRVSITGNYVGAPRTVTDGEETSFIGGGFINDHGISVDDSDTVSIIDNTVFAAGGDGIRATDNYDVTISDNDIFFSGDDGVDVYDTEYADIFDNTIVFSGDDGIFAGDVYSSSIENNLIVLSGNNGISVEGGYETYIEDNFVALSANNGIVVEGTGNPWYGDEYYYGYGEGRGPDWTVNILNNKIVLSGQHGIAAYNTGSVSIDGNEAALSGTDFMGWIEDIIGGSMSESGFDEEEVETYFFALNWGDGDGIHADNAYRYQYHEYYDDDEYELLPAVSITNNNVSWTGGDGIDVSDSSSVFIAGNTVDASGIAVTVFDFYEVMEHISSLNFEQALSDLDSVVDGEGSLIEFLDDVLPTPALTLRSEGNGIRLDGNESVHLLLNLINNSGAAGLFAEGAYNGDIVLQANTFNDNPVGAWFESGIIDLTGEANTFNGGEVGLLFKPTEMYNEDKYQEYGDDFDVGYAPLSLVNNTIGTTNFNDQSRYYVELDNGAFFAPGSPTILDGLNATYDGFRPSIVGGILTPDQYDAIEAKIYHYNDLASLGLFFFGNVPGNNINDKDIYRAIDGFKASNGPLNLTIVGLPLVPGYGGSVGNFLNSIAPAAGGNNPLKPKKFSSMIDELANLEPAAGGNGNEQQGNNNAPQVGESTCWGDAMAAASGGTIVNMSYDGSPDMALSNAAACQSGI